MTTKLSGIVIAPWLIALWTGMANAEPDPERLATVFDEASDILGVIGTAMESNPVATIRNIGPAVSAFGGTLAKTEFATNLATQNYEAAAGNVAEAFVGFHMGSASIVIGRVAGPKAGYATAVLGQKISSDAGDSAERSVQWIADFFLDTRSAFDRRLDAVGLDPVAFAQDYDLYVSGGYQQYASDLHERLRELERAAAASPRTVGGSLGPEAQEALDDEVAEACKNSDRQGSIAADGFLARDLNADGMQDLIMYHDRITCAAPRPYSRRCRNGRCYVKILWQQISNITGEPRFTGYKVVGGGDLEVGPGSPPVLTHHGPEGFITMRWNGSWFEESQWTRYGD